MKNRRKEYRFIKGTPGSLSEAIYNGLADNDSEAVKQLSVDELENIRLHILDFLAQRIGVQTLKYPDCASHFLDLWNEIRNGEKQ